MMPIRTGHRKRGPMIPIRLAYLYSWAEVLEPVLALKVGSKYIDTFGVIYRLHSALGTFLFNSIYSPNVRSCRESGNALLSALQDVMSNNEDLNRDLSHN